MAKAIGITAYSHAATDQSFHKSINAEKIGIYSHSPNVSLQLFIPHGKSKLGDTKYSEISVEIAPKGFRQIIQMMCDADLQPALEAISAELAERISALGKQPKD